MSLSCEIANKFAFRHFVAKENLAAHRINFLAKIELQAAIKLYEREYKQKNDSGVLFYAAKCYQALGEYQKALELLKKTWEADPFSQMLFKEIGFVCIKLGDFEQGLQYALKEVSQFPNSPESKANLAYFLFKNNRYEEAKKLIVEAKNMEQKSRYIDRIYKKVMNGRRTDQVTPKGQVR